MNVPPPPQHTDATSSSSPWWNADWASMMMNDVASGTASKSTNDTVTALLAKYYPRSTHNHTLPPLANRQPTPAITITQLIEALVQCLQTVSMHNANEPAAPTATAALAGTPPRPTASIHHVPISHLYNVQHTVGRALVALVCALNERLCARMLDVLEVHRGVVFADFDEQPYNADEFNANVEQFIAEQTRRPLHLAVQRNRYADEENNSVSRNLEEL